MNAKILALFWEASNSKNKEVRDKAKEEIKAYIEWLEKEVEYRGGDIKRYQK